MSARCVSICLLLLVGRINDVVADNFPTFEGIISLKSEALNRYQLNDGHRGLFLGNEPYRGVVLPELLTHITPFESALRNTGIHKLSYVVLPTVRTSFSTYMGRAYRWLNAVGVDPFISLDAQQNYGRKHDYATMLREIFRVNPEECDLPWTWVDRFGDQYQPIDLSIAEAVIDEMFVTTKNNFLRFKREYDVMAFGDREKKLQAMMLKSRQVPSVR